MTDENGPEVISSCDLRVDPALATLRKRNDARFKDLEDALLVQIHLERKQAAAQDTRLKHTELVQRLHQNALARHGGVAARIQHSVRANHSGVDGFGYDRYIDSELEGQRCTEDVIVTDACEQVRRQYVMFRWLFGDIA
jgi:hypothetical protein